MLIKMDYLNKYQKIADTLDKYSYSKNDSKLIKKIKWVVMEKVHGSNFSIYYEKGNITFSKRNNKLKENEWFYNYHLIKEKLMLYTNQLARLLDNDNFIIYGELFGGFYPKDTKNWNGPIPRRINTKGISVIPFEERAIQEGIYYSNNIEYMVFDIFINNKFMDYQNMIEVLKETDFFYAQPLLIDSYEKVLKFNINFDSKIPKQLNYEELPKNTNIAEGIVIKPITNIYVKNKSDQDVRCLIKIKNKKFLEVIDDFDMNEAKKSYFYVFHNLVNQNRFQSVISKIGKLSNENKEIVIQELYDDVFNDFYTHYNIQYKDFSKVEDYVKSLVNQLVINNLI